MDQRRLHTHADPCPEGPQYDRLVMHSSYTPLINSLKHFSQNPFFCNFSIFGSLGFAPIGLEPHVGGCLFSHVMILHEKSQDATKAATDRYFSFGVLGSDIFDPNFQILKKKKNVGGEISKMGTAACRGFDGSLRFFMENRYM